MLRTHVATKADAEYIGANLRADDAREIETARGLPGTVVAPEAFLMSRVAFTAQLDSQPDPCVIFGVVDDPTDPERGIVWLLATDRVRECAVSVAKQAPRWLDRLSQWYPKGLHVLADARNSLHRRWCSLAGFQTIGHYRINGHTFHHIHRPCANP